MKLDEVVIMAKYGIHSDTHNHNFSAFATILPNGINSRLQATLDETLTCARETKNVGGKNIYHAGDLFHVRGSLAPSVLNPTIDTYKSIIESGIGVRILAGNHDLEGRDSQRISSAVTALEAIGCVIVNESTFFDDDKVLMIPWHPSIVDLKAEIEKQRNRLLYTEVKNYSLIIHAPIDGVIFGLPEHGLTAEQLAEYGFKAVYSGHYHNFKELDNNVYSIGATTHQTWSDVNSIAGFLIVEDDLTSHHETSAPKFVEIDADLSNEEIAKLVANNFVRIKVSSTEQKIIDEIRYQLINEFNAKGVVIVSVRDSVVQREVTVSGVKTEQKSIPQSINCYINHMKDLKMIEEDDLKPTQEKAQEILELAMSKVGE